MKKQFTITELKELIQDVQIFPKFYGCLPCDGLSGIFDDCPNCKGVGYTEDPNILELDPNVQVSFTPAPVTVKSESIRKIIGMAEVGNYETVTIGWQEGDKYLTFEFDGWLRGKMKDSDYWDFNQDNRYLSLV